MLNMVIMMGRLVEDPVCYQSEGNNGTMLTIARYRIAVERDYKKDGKRPVDFFLCKANAGAAEFARDYFRQGDTVLVCGNLYTWPYKKAGEDREHIYSTIYINNHYLARKRSDSARTRSLNPMQDKTAFNQEEWREEDLPPLPPAPPFFDDEEPYEAIYADYKAPNM